MIGTVLMANAGRESMTLDFQQKMNVVSLKGVTPAQITAALNLISPGHGRQIRVNKWRLIVNTADVGGVTDFRLGSTETVPQLIATIVVAGLTTGARIGDMSPTNVTHGPALGVKLPLGVGVQLFKTGAAASGAFTSDVLLEYDVI